MDDVVYEVCGYTLEQDKYHTLFRTKNKDEACLVARAFQENLERLFGWLTVEGGAQYPEPMDWIEIWKGWPDPELRMEILYRPKKVE